MLQVFRQFYGSDKRLVWLTAIQSVTLSIFSVENVSFRYIFRPAVRGARRAASSVGFIRFFEKLVSLSPLSLLSLSSLSLFPSRSLSLSPSLSLSLSLFLSSLSLPLTRIERRRSNVQSVVDHSLRGGELRIRFIFMIM